MRVARQRAAELRTRGNPLFPTLPLTVLTDEAHRLGERDRRRRAAGSRPRARRRRDELRQGTRADALPARRRLRAQDHHGQVVHAESVAASSVSASSRTASFVEDNARLARDGSEEEGASRLPVRRRPHRLRRWRHHAGRPRARRHASPPPSRRSPRRSRRSRRTSSSRWPTTRSSCRAKREEGLHRAAAVARRVLSPAHRQGRHGRPRAVRRRRRATSIACSSSAWRASSVATPRAKRRDLRSTRRSEGARADGEGTRRRRTSSRSPRRAREPRGGMPEAPGMPWHRTRATRMAGTAVGLIPYRRAPVYIFGS